jgi:hypothetical protein
VNFSPPRDHERIPNPSYNGPVEGDDAHAQARGEAENVIECDVVRRDPTNPREHGECLEEIAGEEEEKEGAGKD